MIPVVLLPAEAEAMTQEVRLHQTEAAEAMKDHLHQEAAVTIQEVHLHQAEAAEAITPALQVEVVHPVAEAMAVEAAEVVHPVEAAEDKSPTIFV